MKFHPFIIQVMDFNWNTNPSTNTDHYQNGHISIKMPWQFNQRIISFIAWPKFLNFSFYTPFLNNILSNVNYLRFRINSFIEVSTQEMQSIPNNLEAELKEKNGCVDGNALCMQFTHGHFKKLSHEFRKSSQQMFVRWSFANSNALHVLKYAMWMYNIYIYKICVKTWSSAVKAFQSKYRTHFLKREGV